MLKEQAQLREKKYAMSDVPVQLQEEVVGEEKEDLLEAAIQYACAKHAEQQDLYPCDASKAKRRAIRRRAEAISIRDGKVYYCNRRKLIVEVVTAPAEQQRIAHACHSDKTSGHFGVKKTIGRIAERFYWRGMYKQVSEMVRCTLVQLHVWTISEYTIVYCSYVMLA